MVDYSSRDPLPPLAAAEELRASGRLEGRGAGDGRVAPLDRTAESKKRWAIWQMVILATGLSVGLWALIAYGVVKASGH